MEQRMREYIDPRLVEERVIWENSSFVRRLTLECREGEKMGLQNKHIKG
jgi:hypothetical protein